MVARIISQKSTNNRLVSSIATLRIEITNLTAQVGKLNAEVAQTETLKQKIKSLKSEFDKQQAKVKEKTSIIANLRQELKAKSNVEAESDSESSTPLPKRRKTALLKTPKNKSQTDLRIPNTVPAMPGSYSTLHSTNGSQILAFTPSGTDVASKTPLPNGPRFQTAQFSLSDTTIRCRTRAETMASVQSSDHTPTASHARSGSVITVSSLSSVDSDAVGPDPFG